MAENEEPKLDAVPEASKTKEAGKRRGRDFAKALLPKLPKLGVSQWDASDTFDVYQGMQGVVDLDTDAFLQPLESHSEDRHGER